jgi:predicted transcriptional regulator YheO
MTTAKNVILTAINFKGIDQVKSEASKLAENLFCSESYVKNIIRQVEKGQIVIR